MIGVFDSGHGGLTVLQALRDVLPGRGFVYFGDHGAAPYGNRSRDEIYDLTRTATETLFRLGCRLVVLACNTAASTSLRRLQQEWLPRTHPDRRVLGVVVPMVEAVTGVPWMADTQAPDTVTRTVAIFATHQTVESNAFPVEIGKRAPGIRVVQQACPRLVDLIEAGAPRARMAAVVDHDVGQLLARMAGTAPDVVLLACTHYPLVYDLFAAALPPGVTILSQPVQVARSLAAYLERHPDLDPPAPAVPPRYLTSGNTALVSGLASRFLGRPMTFEDVAAAVGRRSTAPDVELVTNP
jgi:glutamate racemase